MRIDQWLWAVRLYKTRTLATKACQLGKISVENSIAKAARELKIGEIVENHGTLFFRVQVLKSAVKPVRKGTESDFFKYLTVPVISSSFKKEIGGLPKDFRYQKQKDGSVSKRDKKARQIAKQINQGLR